MESLSMIIKNIREMLWKPSAGTDVLENNQIPSIEGVGKTRRLQVVNSGNSDTLAEYALLRLKTLVLH